MKQSAKKNRMPPAVSTALTALCLLVGLALVLYPTVANRINTAGNTEVIAAYERQVQTIDDGTYTELLAAAQSYNDRLFRAEPYIGALTDEERKTYESLLDLDGSGMMGYIEIPKAKIHLAIYHGTEEDVLQTGVGHFEASSLPVPGESVHVVLAGHSGLPSARLFTDLDQLKTGDTFTLHVLRETLTYRVERRERVDPDELNDLQILQGQELCTLMTCTPYGINTHRLVITGRRIENPATAPQQTASPAPLVTSKWNRWYVFLPLLLFAGLATGVVLLRRRRKKSHRPDAADREEETPS